MARLHRDGLKTIYTELPAEFKMHEAIELTDDWSQGNFLKLKQAGLLDNNRSDHDDTRDWFLTQRARYWLEDQFSELR